MFSLIITIVAIALVTALALTTVYYGGAALRQGQEAARVATVVNEGTQLVAAFDLYRAQHGAMPNDTSDNIKQALLDGQYLSTFPDSTVTWTLSNDAVSVGGLSDDQCLAINKKQGVSTIPLCSDLALDQRALCCSVP